jgi:hypothetical protein
VKKAAVRVDDLGDLGRHDGRDSQPELAGKYRPSDSGARRSG